MHGPGYVYVAVNPAFPGRCKIGFAKNLKNRLRQMQTGDPERAYRFHATRYFEDRKLAETMLHALVIGFRIAGTEWFDLHPDDATEFLKGLEIKEKE